MEKIQKTRVFYLVNIKSKPTDITNDIRSIRP